MLPRLILAGLTFAAAVSLVDQLATRNGVGIFEHIVGALLVAALAFVSFRLLLRALHPTPGT